MSRVEQHISVKRPFPIEFVIRVRAVQVFPAEHVCVRLDLADDASALQFEPRDTGHADAADTVLCWGAIRPAADRHSERERAPLCERLRDRLAAPAPRDQMALRKVCRGKWFGRATAQFDECAAQMIRQQLTRVVPMGL